MCVEGGDEFYFEVPRMSSGMIENLLLAIAVSLMLGAKEEQLATKIETIKPLPMRGGIIETEKANFYIDCYNASPTSMRDALNNFAIIAQNKKKLYVLGTMAELGLATHRHHKEIGSNIVYNEGDKVILIASNAEIYKSGLLDSGWSEDDITIFATSAEAKDLLSSFEDGFVFIKGSRVCELEKALPDEVQKLASGNDNIEQNQTEEIDECDEDSSEEEKEAVLMKLTKDGEEYIFEMIEDDEEFNKVVEYIDSLEDAE